VAIAVREEISATGIVTPADLQIACAAARAFCISDGFVHALMVQLPTVSINLLSLQIQPISVPLQLVAAPSALVAQGPFPKVNSSYSESRSS